MVSRDPLSNTKGHRWFAATYDLITRLAELRVFGQLRQRVVPPATGRVLEIGAGTGANFPYYSRVERIVATEPDPYMLRRARKRAQKLALDVELRQAPAEALPFADASFDTVISTLVLCTVTDPARSLAEVRRVLEPGGTFRFVEHVRGDGRLGRVHDLVVPIWSWVGAGCHPNRRTAESIEAAGFEIFELERRRLALAPLIVGVARNR